MPTTNYVMNQEELAIFCLLRPYLVKFPHPITVLNPNEWNEIDEVKLEPYTYGVTVIRIRAKDSAWFRLTQSTLKLKPQSPPISNLEFPYAHPVL